MSQPTIVYLCVTCRGFVGYGNWVRQIYCTDDLCLTDRVRVTEHSEMLEQIAFLHERWSMTFGEIAKELGIERRWALNLYSRQRTPTPAK